MNSDTKTAYEKSKSNIYKWRENNKEKYNDVLEYLIKPKPYVKKKRELARKSGNLFEKKS